MVIVDRYSNWPIVEKGADGSIGLINSLRRAFVTYGIPDELASDGGPEFAAAATTTFLLNWGVHHRLSSVAFPHSNCRAEVAVKTVKRMITGNTGAGGSIDTDRFGAAMLAYRNTPDPETKMSPASILFGRPVRDFIPVPLGQYHPHSTWKETLMAREEALRKRHIKTGERWTENTRRLPPLTVGNTVRVQNQTGNNPKRWDLTGTVIEVRQHDQYVVRVDGSGRPTLRNRKFLRKYTAAFEQPKSRQLSDDLLRQPILDVDYTPAQVVKSVPRTPQQIPRAPEPPPSAMPDQPLQVPSRAAQEAQYVPPPLTILEHTPMAEASPEPKPAMPPREVPTSDTRPDSAPVGRDDQAPPTPQPQRRPKSTRIKTKPQRLGIDY